MKFINVECSQFAENVKSKKIIQFGAASAWNYYFSIAPDVSEYILQNTAFIVDNNPSKQGQEFKIKEKSFEVRNVEAIKAEEDYIIVLAASMAYQKDICEQLLAMGLPQDIECYSLPLMFYKRQSEDNTCVEEYFKTHTVPVNVPKIHSFWFSGEEKPDLYKRCIESWHKYCPDFEIIEWNADNYDITKNQYMMEAFERRKWAFVSDFARLDIVYQYGGIYMDMDVELVQSLKGLLNADGFFCKQGDGCIELGSGFGAKPKDALILELLSTYNDRRFIKENGEMDTTPQPEWLSSTLEKNGLFRGNNSQIIGDRLILSNDYIQCGVGNDLSQKAILGVHWHNGGWMNEKDRNIFKASLEAKNELLAKYFIG